MPFHIFWTAFILAKGAFIAYVFPDIINIISIIGGICCVSIVITFPGI